jgi:predicted acetyltransferase
MRLVRLSLENEDAVREIAADYASVGDPRFDEILADYGAAFRTLEEAPTEFFVARREDGVLVGTARLRLLLNDGLWQNGGNIGYDVRPSMRHRGIGTALLGLVLDHARDAALPWVLLTVEPENAASIRVIEKNGGELLGAAEESGYLRFRINLSV